MKGVAKYVTMVGVVLMLAAGCRTMTGQSLGQNVDDTTTTASVKTELTKANLRSLTWVDVDTVRGTVYLHGTARSQAEKDHATQVARAAAGTDKVVNNIQVVPNATTESSAGRATAAAPVAASPATAGVADMHTMTGDVTAVDHNTGHLTLQTSQGPMTLYFPPQALSQVQRGERVTVDLGLRPAR